MPNQPAADRQVCACPTEVPSCAEDTESPLCRQAATWFHTTKMQRTTRPPDQGTESRCSRPRAGIISLLDEEEPQLKEFALHKLNAVVNDFWAEISESVDKIEVLYEDEGFRSRQFAALVASKVFYHLGAFEESLNYALGAGDLFNVNDNSEYVETIIVSHILDSATSEKATYDFMSHWGDI
ncbi:26S proteasome non-ATPase regulatory subunit 1 [Heterocephalus glaber]|uniref:26S proteasome non-ATPase regulatory subunit 1 n=1 Tax=Heterocephalus glaber TaxID=10181 RepID=G5BGZ0_HETGA|nr:26S proteasome non-ATPase regulatory subunit 1 [Heterocephalus glaber]